MMFFCVLCALVILSLLPAATAAPLPLIPSQNGTVSGDLYVGAFQPTPWNSQSSTPGVKTFTQAYTIPAYTDIQWARLYAVVYAAGTDDREGRATVSFDGNGDGGFETNLGVETLNISSTADPNGYWVNDHCNKVYSDYLMWYDVTRLITTPSVNAQIVTENVSMNFDGRLKTLTLIVAYNDTGADTVKYWVNEGQDYQTSSGTTRTTTFATSPLIAGWTSAELTNVHLSSKDAAYTLNTVPYTGTNPVAPYASFVKNVWDVNTSLNAGSDSTLTYTHAASSSFKTILACLKVRYNATADLQVTSLAYNPGAGAVLFANEPNVIRSTVKNNGTAAAGPFDVQLTVGAYTETKNIAGLAAGANTTVDFTAYTPTEPGNITVTVTVDSGRGIVESDTTNNQKNETGTVYYNGYKGKRFTNGSDMNTAVSFDGKYGIIYSAGNTAYASNLWTTKSYDWSASDLPVPEGATVTSARLYQGYAYNKKTTTPSFTMTFNSNMVTPVATYLDRKGFGTYDYPYGLYVYDVTSRFNTAGNSITITPEAGNDYALYGAYLVVVYQDTTTTEKKIFINDEFDNIWSRATYSTTNNEATVYANFTGADSGNGVNARAIAILASAGDVNKSRFFFNDNEYPGFWSSYRAGPQLGFSSYNVTSALSGSSNIAKLQSYDTAGNGDNMYAMNTILVVEYLPVEKADLHVTTLAYNPGAGAVLFANEPNVIRSTIKNNGTAAAGPFDVQLTVGAYTETKNITGLAAGANTTVDFTAYTPTAAGNIAVTVTADSGRVIVESDTTNNQKNETATVYYNGYKGKRFTNGSDMNTAVSFDGKYGIVYSAGNTAYASNLWTTKSYDWSASDLPVPAGATVTSARLYQGYAYNKKTTDPSFTMTFNSNAVTPDATYMDRKGFGTYDYPYGLYVYDVTSRFNTAGNSITITPEAGNDYALYGAYLVVVYQDPATTEKKIFINDEFDNIWSRATYSTTNDEASVYANIAGVDIGNGVNAQAIAILASAGDVNKSRFFFNGNEYPGFWSNYRATPQIGFSPYDVTGALIPGANTAKFQSYDPSGNGDNMYAMNLILVIESDPNSPTLSIPSNVTIGRDTILTVPVKLAHIRNATGVSFDIVYDPSVIHLNSVTVNPSAIGNNTLTTNLTPGLARIAITSIDGITINEQTAAFNLALTGVGANTAVTSLSALKAQWSETEFNVHPLTVVNGSAGIGVRGDFNGNGFVDIGDTARVAYMVVKLTPVDMAADFNFVGTVDIGDASKIAYYLVGRVAAL